MPLLEKIGFVAACLLLPIVWGAVVNWLFGVYRRRRDRSDDDEPMFPDYQI